MKRAFLIAVVLMGTAALAQAQTFGAWNGGEIDACGGYSVTAAAAFPPTAFGAQGTVSGCYSGMSVTDNTPTAERRYRSRFYFNYNTYDPGTLGTTPTTRRTQLLLGQNTANQRLLAVVLRRLAGGGAYTILARARQDDGTRVDFLSGSVAAGWHFVECDLQLATGAATNDGQFHCLLDGVSFGDDTSVQNFYPGSGVDKAVFGLITTKDFGVAGGQAAGTMYLDEFESRRQTAIGALP